MEQQLTGAQLVLQLLKNHGVEHVFGYPGGAIMPLYDAIYDSEINHYLCRHEQGAAFSALGYARAKKAVGVCIATSGPGATNLITGLADAMADSIPVVAITGQVATKAMGSDAFQEVDIIGLSLACTKHCFQVKHVEQIPEVMQQAFEIALSGRQGPVLVDIPKDIQLAKTVFKPFQAIATGLKNHHQPEAMGKALALLAQAKKPMAYVGGGVGMANAVPELRQFLAQTQMPSVATLKGLGAVAPSNPYYLGMLGMHGTKAANLAVQECDLLIAIGARFDDRVTGKLVEFAPHAKVIHFDIDSAEIGKRRAVDVALLGDLATNLTALAMPLKINPWQQYVAHLKQQLAWQYPQQEHIFAPKLLAQLSAKLPSNAIVTTDVGQHQMWAAQHMQFHQPENFLTSGGLGTMGFGLPAAIGAQLARSQDMVVAVSGDGSFMMNVQELGTIRRYQLPVKIVLVDNGKLGMVRQWQQLFFDQRYSETDLSDNPDFVALAAAFGIKGQCITESNQVEAALDEMLNHQGAYLLQVNINPETNVWPLVPPETANHQMLEQNA